MRWDLASVADGVGADRSSFAACAIVAGIVAAIVLGAGARLCSAASDLDLPSGVRAVWDPGKAFREATPTRERICINGLWRWQPARSATATVPDGGWGFFKVPGPWPGITNFMQKDCQTIYPHPSWKDEKLGDVVTAWYQREITIPGAWAGRRIALAVEYLNSFATVFVDGRRVADLRFPAGEADLTAACRPGETHTLSMLVTAMPLKAVMLSFNDTNAARQVKGSVQRRGLCGDVYLCAAPSRARIDDIAIVTSVRRGELTTDVALQGLDDATQYSLRGAVTEIGGRKVLELTGRAFRGGDLKDGRIAFTQTWKPDRLWDVHTPQNMYHLRLSLTDAGGTVLDEHYPVRFGFREFWIDGRDFYLNGTRIFLSSVPLDNAQLGAAWSTYEGARESMLRLRTFGMNFLYTHNYGCEPGSHLSFEEILKAADDIGMLIALSQPHFGQYDWDAADAEQTNGYARHAEFYVGVARNHPSVVAYATSHNSTGDAEDMNPDLMGCVYQTQGQGLLNNRKKAARAEAIIRRLDPGRIVYHHSSGGFGVIHTSNFYPNWAPVQELSDWFEHWASHGVKPVFTCEYGAPFSWDWTMYRGWYPEGPPKGTRAFGSAKVPWEFCLAEWNAQFFGDRAFDISELERDCLRFEAKKIRSGSLAWNRWDYPRQSLGSGVLKERHPVFAMYLTDNFRAFRTWGVSATSPWEHGLLFNLRDGVDRNARRELATDWERLQRPGFSPDYLEERYSRMDLAYERTDWIPTDGARALMRNNMPLLGYIGGAPDAFTSKDHNFVAGETVEKQIIVLNNSRETVTCACEWSLGLPRPARGARSVLVKTGEQERIPLRFDLPAGTAPGSYELSATMKFSTGEVQKDVFAIHVLPPVLVARSAGTVALFDPRGETGRLLRGLGIAFQAVDARQDLAAYDTLIIGKEALTVDGPGPDIARVRDGLKVILFEQTPEVLEQRLGFRVAAYGLRQVFARVPGHPLLAGLEPGNLRDWRGAATILPPRLRFPSSPENNYGYVHTWAGIPVTRVWRCGNRGSVASALIEKPACGDFLPVVDGGFSLQYSPLMEYREGTGLVLFCQMDVTGRTKSDPAADRLVRNIVGYVAAWKPRAARKVVYVCDPAGKAHLEKAGYAVGAFGRGLAPDQVLVVGPGGGNTVGAGSAAVASWLATGGNVLAIALDEREANVFLPFRVSMKKAEHIAAFFEASGAGTLLAGIGPADVHNRDPRELPLVAGGARVVGDGVLAQAGNANVVFCQLAPWEFPYRIPQNSKRTFRRTSCLIARLLGNMGVGAPTPLVSRVSSPVSGQDAKAGRWLEGLYLDRPEEWDDPYRFFRW